MIPHSLAPFSADNPEHLRFVGSSWTAVPLKKRFDPSADRRSWTELDLLLRRPGARCVLAVSPIDPDTFYGWALAVDGALIWVYSRNVRAGAGGSTLIRGRGLATAMLAAVGIDPKQLTPCRYWSLWASTLVGAGHWRLYYEPEDKEKAECA